MGAIRFLWLIYAMKTHTRLYRDAVFLDFSEGIVRQKGGERPSVANGNSLFLPISEGDWFVAKVMGAISFFSLPQTSP